MATVKDDTAERSPSRKKIDAAKKYWWAPAIAVPVAAAMIQVLPALMGGSAPAGTTIIDNSRIGGDLYFVTNVQIEDPAMRAQFDQAIVLAGAGQYAEAKALFEQMAPGARSAAVYNNLAVVNAVLEDDAAALQSAQQALQLDPANEAVRENLNVLARLVKEQTANNNILSAAPIELGANVESRLAEKDNDFFTFTAPPGPRDIIRVHVENRSTTLSPTLTLFDAARVQLGEQYRPTPGANVSMDLVAAPGAKYFARVTPWGGSGAYTLSVTAQKASDQFEPNDDVTAPREIRVGQEIAANIMDGGDVDVFAIPVSAGTMRVVFTNRSATLAPNIAVRDQNKAQVANPYNYTSGANITSEHPVAAAGVWYVTVAAMSGSLGAYTLRVEQ